MVTPSYSTQGLRLDILELKPLYELNSGELSRMLTRQTSNYLRFFYPFQFDEETIRRQLSNNDDIFVGIYWCREMIGFWFLRQFANGIPEFGLMVDQLYCGYGLGRMSVIMAKFAARFRGCDGIRLTVHVDNKAAYHLYIDCGFTAIGAPGADKQQGMIWQ